MKKSFVKIISRSVFFISIFILFNSFTGSCPPETGKYLSISKYISNNSLSVEIKGLGGFQENCLEFDLKNNTADTLFILIEPGRRIVSKDTGLQDILIVKEVKMQLLSYQNKKINGYGFCCRATKSSPHKDSFFDIGYMAPPGWVKLAEVINKNNFPAGAVQHAVWVFSDNHEISSIYSEKMEDVVLLRKTVASIKGIEVPWYYIKYAKDTSRLFSNRPEKVCGNIEYSLNKNAMVTINVRNKYGKVMATILKEVAHGPGKYEFNLDLPVLNWSKGDYDIFIYEDYSTLNLKKKFNLSS